MVLGGCVHAAGDSPLLMTAQEKIGLDEYRNRTEIREFTGVDPVRTEWCAAFVNAVLDVNNIPGSDSVSQTPLMARSFMQWGDSVSPEDIQKGDVVVFPRGNEGWQGHVGFYVGSTFKDDGEYYVILGGNQDNRVSYEFYKATRAIAIRRHLTPVEKI